MEEYQKILFPYAYNILGSAEDARDAIQDVLSNYVTTPREGIGNEKGYLIKSVINQSINIRNKRKKLRYGDDVWLPEPVATEEADTDINLRDIASYSLLVLLEQLNPKERAVFILKEAFGYSHEEIAGVLSGTVEASRKLLSRAKARLNEGRQLSVPVHNKAVQPGLLDKFIDAIRARDTHTLEALLSQDVVFFADGGDTVKVVKKRCAGLHEVADLLIFVYHKFLASLSVVPTVINHQPALLYYNNRSKLIDCQVFSVSGEGGKIYQIHTVLDPEKLKNIVSIF